uniref:Uncharacterized protein n=1 Tax=Sphaerodactylus townsendi TaxID=933632 RepID=A0ACB8FKF5_9SAUR
MSNPSNSPEDAAKQRSRDGKMRREEADEPQPEGKRLKLGNEGTGEEEGADEWTGCSGTEESGTQTDGEGQTVIRELHFEGKEVLTQLVNYVHESPLSPRS